MVWCRAEAERACVVCACGDVLGVECGVEWRGVVAGRGVVGLGTSVQVSRAVCGCARWVEGVRGGVLVGVVCECVGVE